MAKRFSRRRGVRGRPNYSWITTAGTGTIQSSGVDAHTLHDNILIPSDWQMGEIVENETTLCHMVYTHAIYGSADTSTHSFCSLYALVKTNDAAPGTSPANLGSLTLFPVFFTEYDECLHWGQYTAMPYDALFSSGAYGAGVWPAGGSLAGMPENMVNLNVRRKLKPDEAIKVMWGAPLLNGMYTVRWYARSLVRLGLK